jgi:phenylacetate-coenzyme A ligase PaaK-like adenylate-forming protein
MTIKSRSGRCPLPQQRQMQTLRHYLKNTVLPFSQYYRSLAIDPDKLKTFDDLRRLPFTLKTDVQDHVRDFILQPDRRLLSRRPGTLWRALLHGRAAVAEMFEHEFRPLMMTLTTGRSSEPVAFVYTGHDIDNLRLMGRRIMEIAGANREMRMVNMFPYAPHLAFWQTHYAGTEYGVFMVSSGGGKVMGTEGNLRLIQKLSPDILIGMPTFLYHVLQEAIAHHLQTPHLKKLVLGGEKAPAGMRRRLRALAAQLGAPDTEIITIYGFTEAKMAWPECPPPAGETPSGFHIFPDLAIIEIVNPHTGEPVGEGQPGEIVFTPLNARGTVVLRYRTGDCIEGGLVYEPCPHCHRRLPRLVGRMSRNSEIKEMKLDKFKGTLIDFNQLEHVLDNVDAVGTWQLELRKAHDDPLDLDELILHVHKIDHDNEEHLRKLLNERVASVIEVHPNKIIFHTEEEMRRLQGVGIQLKEQRVVDHRPKP